MEDKNFNKPESDKDTPVAQIPYIAYESAMARMERQIKRLWVALVVAIVAIFATNIAWLYYESNFETVSYCQDGEGLNNLNTGTHAVTAWADIQATENRGGRGYSMDDSRESMIEKLHEMLDDAPNEKIRNAIHRLINQLDED